MSLPSTLANGVGLASSEAQRRLIQDGPNELPEQRANPIRNFVRKFWGPVPWMLEASIILQLVLGRVTDALITLALLVVNALLSFAQESKAQTALALLQQSLSVQARALRDAKWQLLPARDLVLGDVIHLRVGDIVPADVKLLGGQVSADQSALTGESAPAEVDVGQSTYAGSIIRRGEATCEVTGTGQKTYYGKTAQLVRTAKTPSQLETVIQGIVKYLIILNGVLALAVLAYALASGKTLSDFLPFTLMLLVASIPMALPATFTLTAAIGSQVLAKRGVLVTRLSAIEEAAAMDVLCSDKTGTLTLNQLALAAVKVFEPFSEATLLRLAALASDEATQDPIDLAILAGARQRGIRLDDAVRTQFVPFDPATKRTEAEVNEGSGSLHIVKGFPNAIGQITGVVLEDDVELLAEQGYRVIAVACDHGDGAGSQLVGLIGLQDPPRPESADIIARLRNLGVRILMITGDGLATAKAVATQVGLGGRACSAEVLREPNLDGTKIDCDIFAGVFPEDKFNLVRAMQRAGHVVGMTGDGVNDSPALKQAEVGVAVANATDVAKAAASLVLINPGLNDMLAAVEVGRSIYQRMLTYTLNKLVKTLQVGLFLSLGLFMLGELVTRPRLILLLLFANDFVTMAIATDNVRYSQQPNHWRLKPLIASAAVLALGWLAFSFAVLGVAHQVLMLSLSQTQTLVFLMLVFTGQANVYLARERGHFWSSMPSLWLLISSIADIAVVSALAVFGVLMTPVPLVYIVGLAVAILAFMVALDAVKVAAFRRLRLGD